MDISPTQTPAQAITFDGPSSPSGDPSCDDPFVALLAGLLQPQILPLPAAITSAPSEKGAYDVAAAAQAAAPVAMPVDAAGTLAGAPAPLAQALRPAASSLEAIPTRLDVAEAASPIASDMPQAQPNSAPATPQPAKVTAAATPDPAGSAPTELRKQPPAEPDAMDAGDQAPDSSTGGDVPPQSPALARAGLKAEPADRDRFDPAPQRLPDGAPAINPASMRAPSVTDASAAGQVPIAAPPMTLPSLDHRGRLVSARLIIAQGDRGSSVRIDLEPADLGRVEVALHVDDAGLASATFTVDRPETLQLLQRDARAVGELLGSSGFTVQQGALGFTLRDSPGSQQGPERGERSGRTLAARGGGEPGPARALASRQGLLDLRV